MRPILEQELRHTDSGVHGGYVVDVETGDDVASVSKEYEHLRPAFAAVPDMVRMLVEVRDAIASGTLSEDAPEAIERVLRKTGAM